MNAKFSVETTSRVNRRGALRLFGAGVGVMGVGALLAACSSSVTPTSGGTGAAPAAPSASSGTGAVTAASPAATAPASKQSVTLQFDNLWDAQNNTHYQGMQYLYKQFKAAHPEITIKEVIIPTGDLAKKEKADCAAGSCPDIMHDLDGTFWSSGYLLDLTSYLNGDPTWKGQFEAGPLAFCSTDGHYWGMPTEVNPMDITWNSKILGDAGVGSIPATWDELLAACDKIKKLGKIPTTWAIGGGLEWDAVLASQKGGIDALKANTFDAAPILDTFKLLKTFVDNKWLPDNEIELTSDQAVANFLGEQVAFYMDGAWTIKNNILSSGASPDLKNHVKFSPFPGTADSGTVVEQKVATMNGLSKALSKDQAKLDGGITFFKFWLSPDIAKQWITLTWSPMGITVNMKDVQGLDPLPTQFLSVQDQAKTVFTLPPTKAMQDHQWDQAGTAMQTLLQGKSADEALKAYTQFLAQYKAS